jgi:hypothetical protein
MDAITTLRQQALAKRNARILAAKREYHAALMEIKALARKLGINQRGRPNKGDESGLRAATVAKDILSDGPMTIAELTIEVQQRGCRSLDDPRKVADTIRNALYRDDRFRKDDKGRWATIT